MAAQTDDSVDRRGRQRGAHSDRTVDPAEVERFNRMAADWWDPNGSSAPLHKLNPTRLAWLRDRLCERFGRDPLSPKPLQGLSIVDVGCGGGLITEPLARLGASMTGVDAAAANIAVARAHAAEQGLAIDYRETTAEALAADGSRFDAVVSLEVVEHVADLDRFLSDCVALAKPGAPIFLSTLNRTGRSFLSAIVAAEYVLRWLPRGTHDWRRFVKPSELAASLRRAGARLANLSGMSFNPVSGRWSLSDDLSINYLAMAEAPE